MYAIITQHVGVGTSAFWINNVEGFDYKNTANYTNGEKTKYLLSEFHLGDPEFKLLMAVVHSLGSSPKQGLTIEDF